MRSITLLGSVQSLPRDLRLLFLALFLWTFGLGVYNFVWPLYLTQLNANPEQVGLVTSVGAVSAAVSMIPGGILASKYDAKILLILGWGEASRVHYSSTLPGYGLMLFRVWCFFR